MRTPTRKSRLLRIVIPALLGVFALSGFAQEPEPAGEPAAPGPGGLLASPFTMMLLIIAIFWFVVLMPQRKQQKRHQARVNALKSGDRVLTSGGIYGTVRRRNDQENRITLEIAKGIQVEVAKNAISSIVAERSETSESQ